MFCLIRALLSSSHQLFNDTYRQVATGRGLKRTRQQVEEQEIEIEEQFIGGEEEYEELHVTG